VEIIIRLDADSAACEAARLIAEELRANPQLVLGLATGRTMESVYHNLVRMHQEEDLDFSGCRTFNLDEYVGLATDDPSSYHHFMKERLFSKVNIDPCNTHLPDPKASHLKAECKHYERLIVEAGGIDLQLLGIGLNGHLGFNEPFSALQSRTHVQTLDRVTRNQNALLFSDPARMPHQAITMGVGTILEARRCILIATGSNKADIIARSIEGKMTAMITATALQLHPACTVVLDEAAASNLSRMQVK